MADTKQFITKIKLPDGSTRYICDSGAPRIEDLDNYLPLAGGTVTGKLTVTDTVEADEITVTELTFIPASETIDNVLVANSNGDIKKRSTDNLLADIGGMTCEMDDSTGTLTFKIGK